MQISSLHVYPVKSCRAVSVEAVDVGEQALDGDRRFLVIRPDGEFLSQRQKPGMARIEASVEGSRLALSAPRRPSVQLDTRTDGPTRRVEVWRTPCEVVDQGEAAASWLSETLETPARLVAMAAGYRRPLHPQLPREHDGHLLFADAAPILVASEASLADLNGRLEAPLPMDRFRPNLVVSGCEPYAEDGWAQVRIGRLELTRLMPCGRCAITTIDQATGERGKEPLATLAGYRKHPDLGAVFGTYFAHLGTGRLSVGDLVEPVDAVD